MQRAFTKFKDAVRQDIRRKNKKIEKGNNSAVAIEVEQPALEDETMDVENGENVEDDTDATILISNQNRE